MSNSSEQAINVIEPLIADLSQSDAFMVLSMLCRKFDWSGTMFTPDDVSEMIQHRREGDDLDPLPDEQLEEMTNDIINSRDWYKFLPDWITEQGWEIINQSIFDREETNGNR
jgi:hypothetical protein